MSYLNEVRKKMQEMEEKEQERLNVLSQLIADRLGSGGIIHLFGCGHSSLLAQDAYYRAGGLVPVRPILIEPLMLHQGGQCSSAFERKAGFVESYLMKEDIREGDVVIVISISGRNPAPIDAALYCLQKGADVIGVTSLDYAHTQTSRHPSGKRLEEVTDYVLDLPIPVGDATLRLEGLEQAFSPMSTVLGSALLQDLFSRTIKQLHQSGCEVPIFKSGNVDGSDEHNAKMAAAYKRISF
ncbi:SIS domain-containing protein [Halobacillus locisalis]|uniref:SIS domain-containing protein n=1 Tax=Halobacillus locisalis TaxID=220753 RepID=A0A838CQ60_9BACI|nr:SIS domain-containing protein [Halobacillus locisalis]MBA2174207.1 SIS domain-containing protein [Halobacillus locisalis]